jgi:hypothetical protein
LSPVFDGAVVAVGFLLGIVAVVARADLLRGRRPIYLFSVPLIMLMGWFPMLIGRTGGWDRDRARHVRPGFLAVVTEPIQALAIWWLGTFACQLLSNKRVVDEAVQHRPRRDGRRRSPFCIDATRGRRRRHTR